MKELISLRLRAGLDIDDPKVVLIRKAAATLRLGERFIHRRDSREQKRPHRPREGSEADIIAWLLECHEASEHIVAELDLLAWTEVSNKS